MSNVLEIPSLDNYEITDAVIDKIIANTSHKHHPVTFTETELRDMIQLRINVVKGSDA